MYAPGRDRAKPIRKTRTASERLSWLGYPCDARRSRDSGRSTATTGAVRITGGSMGAVRHGARFGADFHRRDRGEHRASAHRARVPCRGGGAAVDRQRIHTQPRIANPARWLARRPFRAPQSVRHWRDLVRRSLVTVRSRAQRPSADCGPGGAGDRRRAADAGVAGDPRGLIPSGRPRPRDRSVVGPRRDRGRAGAFPRRLAGAGFHLAPGLPDQRAAGRGGRGGRPPAHPRVA